MSLNFHLSFVRDQTLRRSDNDNNKNEEMQRWMVNIAPITRKIRKNFFWNLSSLNYLVVNSVLSQQYWKWCWCFLYALRMLFADSKVLFTFVHFFSLFFQHPLHCWIWRSILLKKKKEWRRKRHQLQNGKIQEMRVAIVFTRQRFFTSRFITSHPPFLASSRSGRELSPT